MVPLIRPVAYIAIICVQFIEVSMPLSDLLTNCNPLLALSYGPNGTLSPMISMLF
ncbi:MAG: hypothetical protein QOE41_877 [Mycobacterium sp.]|jgi:hypothetical protein|nr:hypothetical protein [Mycobacterium sp.]